MALGTMTLVTSLNNRGPVFVDHVTLVGEASYLAGGSAGLKTKLQALTKDGRVPFAVHDAGVIAASGYRNVYDPTGEKLAVYRTDQVDDPDEEVPDATALSGLTFNLVVYSR